MKYTDAEKWKYMKLDYRRRNELSDHPELKLPDADKAVVPDGKFTKYLLEEAIKMACQRERTLRNGWGTILIIGECFRMRFRGKHLNIRYSLKDEG